MSDKTIRNKTIEEALEKSAKAICTGCGYLDGYKCTYNGANCGVSKPMLESVTKALMLLKEDPANEFLNFDSPVVDVDKRSYNKAIDEFVKALEERSESFSAIPFEWVSTKIIREIAEQMKEVGE